MNKDKKVKKHSLKLASMDEIKDNKNIQIYVDRNKNIIDSSSDKNDIQNNITKYDDQNKRTSDSLSDKKSKSWF